MALRKVRPKKQAAAFGWAEAVNYHPELLSDRVRDLLVRQAYPADTHVFLRFDNGYVLLSRPENSVTLMNIHRFRNGPVAFQYSRKLFPNRKFLIVKVSGTCDI